MPEITLRIAEGNTIYEPIVEDDIILKQNKSGSPSSLAFTIINDGINSKFGNGAAVSLYVDHIPTFHGFIFSKKTNRDKHFTITAYDRLRYLKNKFTYKFEDKRADEILKMIAEDYQLPVDPNLPNTGYLIPSYVCQNKELFSIISEALDMTYDETKVQWILFDDFGRLTLGSPETMYLNVLLTGTTAADFSYESTIDEQTYNDVFLVKMSGEEKVMEYAHYTDDENIQKWGLLRYFEEVNDSTLTLESRAKTLLEIYNQETRRLTIKREFGDVRLRPGALLNCSLDLGDLVLNKVMMINQATHNISHDRYTTDLVLEGGKVEGGQFVA